MSGKLIIVPTPIGNLGDMTPRALDALRQADVICAEDTRVTGKLLSAFDIEGKPLERLDENTLSAKVPSVIARIREGETVAYCTDAGMPGVSDPGLRLVEAARKANAPVEVLPGANAATTAYVASGVTCPQFYFGGFFPRKDAARHTMLQNLASLDAALIFCESPNRLRDALDTIAQEFPLRAVAVCRELTKLHEEVVRGTAPEVAREFAERDCIKGEVVIVIDAPSSAENEKAHDQALAKARLRAHSLLAAGERPKSAARIIADEFDLSRNDAYELVLSLKVQQVEDIDEA